jgi:hypothetical protein
MEIFSQSKVDDDPRDNSLAEILLFNHNILEFDIAMHDSPRVQVVESL